MVETLIRALEEQGAFCNKETAATRSKLMSLLPKEDELDNTKEAELTVIAYEDALTKVAFKKGLEAGIEFASKK